MKKRWATISFLMFLLTSLIAQDITWEKVYEHEGFAFNNPVMDMLPLSDEGYLLVGTAFYNNAINYQFIRVIKTDTLGNTIWEKFLNKDDDQEYFWQQANSIAPSSDGNFIICAIDHVFQSEEKAYFIKIDTNGDTLWTKKYLFENTAKSLKMIALGNDEFAFAGTTTDTSFNHHVLLGKIDSDGELLWSQTYLTDESTTEAWDLKQTNDNGFVLCGKTDQDIFIIKTDVQGQEEWTNTFEFEGWAAGFSILQTSDNGYLIGGGYYDVDTLKTLILKTNAQGDSLWTKRLGNQHRFITNMHQNADNSIAVTTAESGFFSGMFGGAGDFFKIDENGNIDQHLPLIGQGNDIESGNDGCYLIGGSFSPPEDFKEFMYLAKIGGLIDSNEEVIAENPAKIFPNPANQFLQIQIPSFSNDLTFQLFDSLGRQARVRQIKNESSEISTDDLPTGLYFYILKNNQKILQSGKIVIEQ